MEKNLLKMHLDVDRSQVLKMIQEAEKNKTGGIVINDARLLSTNHPNYNVSLGKFIHMISGHVIYTGAKSRSGHNRAVDLELFLCPTFTPKHHFASIEVRIPAEFLSYRGNVAVRKSALWGTDIYTDDSDVVASNSSYYNFSDHSLWPLPSC